MAPYHLALLSVPLLAALSLPAVAQPAAETAPAVAEPAEPQALPPQGPLWQWASSAGFNHYREPGLDMRLRGPELGLHWRLSDVPGWPRWQAEADVLASLQRYDSPSGRLDNAENLETRWRLLYQVWSQDAQKLYIGPAVHTLYNDLRGRTSRGAGGYQRESAGLWLAVQWRQALPGEGALSSLVGWQLDAGALLHGRHRSYLSQASRLYPDLTNTQKRGLYAQARLEFKAGALLLQPFVRYTDLADSEPSTVDRVTGIEPASRRWQMGLSAAWPPR
jgi:hypothetical protein